MYDYFANKIKHRLIVKNIYENMAIYLKNRYNNGYFCDGFFSSIKYLCSLMSYMTE